MEARQKLVNRLVVELDRKSAALKTLGEDILSLRRKNIDLCVIFFQHKHSLALTVLFYTRQRMKICWKLSRNMRRIPLTC
jgi:hypothetical protein